MDLPDRLGLSHHWTTVWPSPGALPGPALAGSTVLAGQVTDPVQLLLMWCTALFPEQTVCTVASEVLAGTLGSSCQSEPGVVAVRGHSYIKS